MKKIFTIIMMMLASVATFATETTLWEGSYTGEIEINNETVATFKAGDVLRVYVTVPEGGANFKIVYKGAPDWSETTIPSAGTQWPWINGGDTYYDVTFTNADLTAMDGKNIYIYKGDNSTITKVTLITEDPEPVGEQTVWEGNEAISWNPAEVPGTQYEVAASCFTGLAKNNLIKFYTTTTYESPQYVVTYKAGSSWSWIDLSTTFAEDFISYTVENDDIASEIAERGVVMRGQAYNLTKITITKSSPTSINQIEREPKAEVNIIYNLAGQKVENGYKGIVIKNGRKYIK